MTLHGVASCTNIPPEPKVGRCGSRPASALTPMLPSQLTHPALRLIARFEGAVVRVVLGVLIVIAAYVVSAFILARFGDLIDRLRDRSRKGKSA